MAAKPQTNHLDSVIDPAQPWQIRRPYGEFPSRPYTRTRKFWKTLLARANEGNPEAESELAAYFEYGCKDSRGRVLATHSSRKAAQWYRRAAEHGDSGAQLALGNLFGGKGAKANLAESLRWYKKSFRGAYASSAANNIAVTYRQNGRLRQAVAWFRKGVVKGDDAGMGVQLGIHYYWGKGVRADHASAVRLFRRAIRVANPSAISEYERDNAFFYLAIAYLEGKGVKRSISMARKLLERANKDGDHPPAARLLQRIWKELLIP